MKWPAIIEQRKSAPLESISDLTAAAVLLYQFIRLFDNDAINYETKINVMPKKNPKNQQPQQVSQVANMNSKQKKVRKHVKGVTFKTETLLDVLITCQLHTATFRY